MQHGRYGRGKSSLDKSIAGHNHDFVVVARLGGYSMQALTFNSATF
jgi:hypothetical protein